MSLVHLAAGAGAPQTPLPRLKLDGRIVTVIDSRLTPRPERAELVDLSRNANLAFMGGKLVGADPGQCHLQSMTRW